MKAKDFIKKYDLDNKRFSPKIQDDFLSDFTSELIAWLEEFHARDNITAFNNAVKVIRQKWDGVSLKVKYGLSDGLWNYFYATVICKLREEWCPAESAKLNKKGAKH